MPSRRGNKNAFLAAFRATGSIGKAADAAGVRRELHYRWMNDPAYKAEFNAVCAEISSERADHARAELSRRVEKDLRSEIGRLQRHITGLGKDLRRKIRDLEAKLANSQLTSKSARPEPPSGCEEDALLDQIARGMGKKPFSRLSPTHQDAVRNIAARINGEHPD